MRNKRNFFLAFVLTGILIGFNTQRFYAQHISLNVISRLICMIAVTVAVSVIGSQLQKSATTGWIVTVLISALLFRKVLAIFIAYAMWLILSSILIVIIPILLIIVCMFLFKK